jgi:hypothetical protein
MNEAKDLSFQISESRLPEWRARGGKMPSLGRDAVQRGITFQEFDRKLSPMRQQLVDQGGDARDHGVGALGRKPLHLRNVVPAMNVHVLAFGFKYGIPNDVDLLFDVRFLRNPNYDPVLQPMTGNDREVGEYIESDPALAPFLEKLFDLLDFVLPRYAENGKEEITIGIGCTGGRHRSVYVAKRLAEHLSHAHQAIVSSTARDIGRGQP